MSDSAFWRAHVVGWTDDPDWPEPLCAFCLTPATRSDVYTCGKFHVAEVPNPFKDRRGAIHYGHIACPDCRNYLGLTVGRDAFYRGTPCPDEFPDALISMMMLARQA